MLAPYPADRLHNQHPPPPASNQSRQPNSSSFRGSILDADPPAQGVKIARRNTRGRAKTEWPKPAAASARVSHPVSDPHSKGVDFWRLDRNLNVPWLSPLPAVIGRR